MSPLAVWIRSFTLILIAVVAAAVAFSGCGPRSGPGASVALAQFAELRQLQDVRLGMTVEELRALRPAITTAPYAGALEAIGRDTIWYLLDRPPDREPGVGRDQLEQLSRSRVVAVASTRRVPSEQSADSLAREWVSRLGVPDECFLHHYPDVTNEAAVYRQVGRHVFVTKRPPSTQPGGLRLNAGVQLLVAAPDSRAVPRAPRVEPTDCALLFSADSG